MTENSSKLFWTTTAISVLWAAGGVALSKAINPDVFSSMQATKDFFTSPAGLGVVAGVALPVAMFWGFAQLVKRAQEMHLAARSMSEAAMRLLQPEAVSGDRVSTLGQAVRREVAAMNEGIERTLARAVELETLVQSEVNQLERAYSDNEVRIRSLVSDLGNEREAVVSHAERVRSSISGAHEQLKEELSSASNIIRDNVLSASQQLSTLLTESGERLIGSINESGGAIAEAIETRTGDIGSRITTSGEAFANLLDTRIATLDEQSRTVSDRLAEALDERTSGIANLLGGATQSMVSEFDTRLANLESTLSERGRSLLSEFEARAHALDSSTEKLNAALETRSRQINENLIARTREIAETFSSGRASLSTMIDETKTKIGEDRRLSAKASATSSAKRRMPLPASLPKAAMFSLHRWKAKPNGFPPLSADTPTRLRHAQVTSKMPLTRVHRRSILLPTTMRQFWKSGPTRCARQWKATLLCSMRASQITAVRSKNAPPRFMASLQATRPCLLN